MLDLKDFIYTKRRKIFAASLIAIVHGRTGSSLARNKYLSDNLVHLQVDL